MTDRRVGVAASECDADVWYVLSRPRLKAYRSFVFEWSIFQSAGQFSSRDFHDDRTCR